MAFEKISKNLNRKQGKVTLTTFTLRCTENMDYRVHFTFKEQKNDERH